jgi:putative tryptophan/tyrosine transport system substrate-binding protein
MAINIARRKFIAALGGTAFAWPFAAHAQQADLVRRIGALTLFAQGDLEGQANAAAFVQGLGALDWHEGSNLLIDWRWAGGVPALFERYAVELVALDPDVLFAVGTPTVEALRRQTSTIPIVFVQVNDPVGQGFVASLTHPGGNITGFSIYDAPLAGKWLGMLTQITPPVARVAVLYNPAVAPEPDLTLRAVEEAARSLTVAVQAAPCRDDAEVTAIMAELARQERGGLLVLPDSFTVVHRDAIVALAAQHRLPAVYAYRIIPAAGGLMSYGVDLKDQFRRTATYVDRILRGAKPADLPIQAPTKFELAINLKTAKALGLTVAPSLLATADEVIE